MKKILALILALVMLFALTLTGCGGNPGGTETGNGGEGGGAFVAGARPFVFPQLIEAERQSQKGKEGALVWKIEVALGGEVGAGEGAFIPIHRLPQPPRLLKAPAQRVTHAAARNAV